MTKSDIKNIVSTVCSVVAVELRKGLEAEMRVKEETKQDTQAVLRQLPLVKDLVAKLATAEARIVALNKRVEGYKQANARLLELVGEHEERRVELQITEIEDNSSNKLSLQQADVYEGLCQHLYGDSSCREQDEDVASAEQNWGVLKQQDSVNSNQRSSMRLSCAMDDIRDIALNESGAGSDEESGRGPQEDFENNSENNSDSDSDNDSDEESLEVDEVEINGCIYYTEDEDNGTLYRRLEDGEIGEKLGHLKAGAAFFS